MSRPPLLIETPGIPGTVAAAPAGLFVRVAVGVLSDHEGRILVQQRARGTHLAGLWEFPGGKIEPDEAASQALARELHEELGIEVVAAERLIRVRHAYPEKTVELDVWRIAQFAGRVMAREGQPLRWVAVSELPEVRMPPADAPIIAALAGEA